MSNEMVLDINVLRALREHGFLSMRESGEIVHE